LIRRLIDNAVPVRPKPAVLLSGGIDSAIVLYHLKKKCKETIYTYTVAFSEDDPALEEAAQVAEYFSTNHKECVIHSVPWLLRQYEEIIPHLERPSYDLWLYPIAKVIKEDGRITMYTGDGLDEHFGGYWYRRISLPANYNDYLEDWSVFYRYMLPPRECIARTLELVYEAPFYYLDFRKTLPYYDWMQEKQYLREAYRGILPDWILNRRKRRGGIDYWRLWKEGLRHLIRGITAPKSVLDIRTYFHMWVTNKWLEAKVKSYALVKED